LVGNKSDLNANREVTLEEGIQLSKLFGCEFTETSAKTNENVDHMFHTIARLIRQQSLVEPPKKKKKKKCIIL
jgi:GTPase KRas protein